MAFVLIWQLDDEVVRRLEQRAAGTNVPLKARCATFWNKPQGKVWRKRDALFGNCPRGCSTSKVAIGLRLPHTFLSEKTATAVMGH